MHQADKVAGLICSVTLVLQGLIPGVCRVSLWGCLNWISCSLLGVAVVGLSVGELSGIGLDCGGT